MNAYIYQGALWCEDCGRGICADLTLEGKAPSDPDLYDSDDFPKGPFPDGGGEADSPQHCDGCGVFLENDLTDEGREYVRDTVLTNMRQAFEATGRASVEWARFYDMRLTVED